MYTKLYRSIVDGSLYGRREALTVFFVMLALADSEGNVDVLPKKIADILGENEDFVNIGIAELSAPDPISRTPTAEGRRILLLNDHRTWGWKITNYEAYRKIRDEEERREYQRQWDRTKRKRPTINPTASDTSDHVRPKTTNTEAEAEAEATTTIYKTDTVSGLSPDVLPLAKKNGKDYKLEALEVLEFLNTKTGKKFRGIDGNNKPTSNLRLIIDRLKSGVNMQDCKTLIARKHRDWSGDDKMKTYLRPSTLFRASNFENYLGECVPATHA